MLTSVKYSHEPGNFVWTIPFPFAQESDVGVRLASPDGQEKQLTLGIDYGIQAGNVVYVLPPEHSLVIYLDAPLQAAMAANSQRIVGQASPMASVQSVPVATAALIDEPATIPTEPAPSVDSERLAELEEQVARLQDERDAALVAARQAESDKQILAVKDAGQDATEAIGESEANAIAAIRGQQLAATAAVDTATSNLKSAALMVEDAISDANACASNIDDTAANAIARLEARVAELEARLCTCADRQEASLVSACAEVTRTATSEAIQNASLATAAASDASDSVNDAARFAGQAGTYASQAQESANTATLKAADSLVYAQRSEAASNAATNQANLAAGHANVARTNADIGASLVNKTLAQAEQKAANTITAATDCVKSVMQEAGTLAKAEADRAYSNANRADDAARTAHQDAWQVSIACAKPGIAAVKDISELQHVVSGVYFINPYLVQTPTMFYGVWAVDSIEEIEWDGIFFIGGEKWNEQGPNTPPAQEEPAPEIPVCKCETCPLRPEIPEPAPVEAGNDWQPCKHTHNASCPNCAA